MSPPSLANLASAPPDSEKAEILVTQDSINQPDVLALLQAHIESLSAINSANNQMGHLLDLSGLQQPSITLFTVRHSISNELMGCAAMKEINPIHGEMKSMRTVPSHLRKGVAAALVRELIKVAKERGYRRLSLETGVQEQFKAARELYKREGFADCGPYEGYEDGVPVEGSVFMTVWIGC